MVNGELPDGWMLIELANCVDILDNRRKPINAGEREKRIAGKDVSKLYPYYGATGKVGLIDDYLLDEEVVLLGEDGAPFLDFGKDKAYIVRGKSWVNNHAHVLKARDGLLTNLFLMHYLNYFDYHGYVTGTTRLKLNQGQMRQFPIKVPPLPEQERIVAKIEELFTQLEAGTSALERVQAGLRRYKASVLKAAVEGRIFGDLELEDAELPVDWKWTTVSELAAEEPYSITDGPFGSKLKTEHYTESGPRVIRLQNIGDGEFRDAKSHISQQHFETLKRHRIYAGDLVIAGMGESLPRACIIPEYVGDAIVKADCMRFKPNSKLAETKYLLFALNSETVKKLVAKVVHGIGRPRMNQQEVKAIPIPLPPLEEQRRIVAEVERRLSVAREVESVVEKALARSARLRQAVLKSAFEGKLT